TGSATPLAWAHAEYLKLCRSLRDGRVFDLPPQPVQRYLVDKATSPRRSWHFNHKLRDLPADKSLRIETLAPATIHWTNDKWQTINDTDTADTGLGIHYIDIPSTQLPASGTLEFTFYWKSTNCWENQNFEVYLA
ncbi:MAG: glucan 1,4-alpha-glucosidase, partial [Candidatus Saccharimonas sp.]